MRDSGRIVFRCEQAFDTARPEPLLHPRPNSTAIRAAVLLHQAIEDAEDGALLPAPRLPRLLSNFDPQDPPSPIRPDDLRARPTECAFASLAELMGRTVRNPAFAVLKSHGILPAGIGYRAWLATVSDVTEIGRVFQNPRIVGSEAARIRRIIQDYVLADPAREPAILAHLADICRAVGINIAGGPAGADALFDLLDNPWTRASIPRSAGIQVVKSAGPSGPSGRAGLAFSDGMAEVDLFELGPDRREFGSV